MPASCNSVDNDSEEVNMNNDLRRHLDRLGLHRSKRNMYVKKQFPSNSQSDCVTDSQHVHTDNNIRGHTPSGLEVIEKVSCT